MPPSQSTKISSAGCPLRIPPATAQRPPLTHSLYHLSNDSNRMNTSNHNPIDTRRPLRNLREMFAPDNDHQITNSSSNTSSSPSKDSPSINHGFTQKQAQEFAQHARIEDLTERADPKEHELHSSNPDISRRIFEDLCNRLCECPICWEIIEPDGAMWSCRCSSIYHFSCIEKWAARRVNWQCPTCNKNRTSVDSLGPYCWCKRKRHDKLTGIGNSCGEKCDHPQTCDGLLKTCSRRCEKNCHPGPCEKVICFPECVLHSAEQQNRALQAVNPFTAVPIHQESQQVTVEAAELQNENGSSGLQNESLSCLQRFNSRRRLLDPRRNKLVMICLIIILTIQVFFWTLCFKNAQWRTQPLKYKHFTDNMKGIEGGLAVVFLTLIFMLNIECWTTGTTAAEGIVVDLFNVKPEGFCYGIVYLVLILVFIVSPYPAFFLMDLVSWKNQMSGSCEGFNTRFDLDNDHRLPASSFGNFKLSTTVNQTKSPFDPFHAFHRLSENRSTGIVIIVDFDLGRNSWRMLQPVFLNSTTGGSAIIEERLIRNGTWSDTTISRPHLVLPELQLQIPSMYYFTQKRDYQPFMTVFKTDMMPEAEIARRSEEPWKSGSDDNVVMRTASFGLGMSNLEVCAKVNHNLVHNKKSMKKGDGIGLGDEYVVPLGLMAVLRRQMLADGRFPRDCGDGYFH